VPTLLACDVVQHEIERQGDARGVQVGRERGQVVHRPEVGSHRAVVHDRVAAVVGAGPRRQQWHEVQVGHAEVAQVPDALANALQVPCEQVGIRHVADSVGGLEPVGPQNAVAVALAQVGSSRGVDRSDDVDQGGEDARRVVHSAQPVPQVDRPAVEPGEHVSACIVTGQCHRQLSAGRRKGRTAVVGVDHVASSLFPPTVR
jgi:hypothetical protein